MMEFPIVIGNAFSHNPIFDCGIEFKINYNVGDYNNLITLFEIIEEIKGAFSSRFSLTNFMYLLQNINISNFNVFEKEFANIYLKHQLGQRTRQFKENKDQIKFEGYKEILMDQPIYTFIESIINLLDRKDIDFKIDFSSDTNLINSLIPYTNLSKLIENNFFYIDRARSFLDAIDLDQRNKNIDFNFSEESFLKSLLFVGLITIDAEAIAPEIKSLKNINLLKIEFIKDEFPALKTASNEEIIKNFENGHYEWFEKTLEERLSSKILREIKTIIKEKYMRFCTGLLKDKDLLKNKLISLKESYDRIKNIKANPSSKNIESLILKETIKPVFYICDEVFYGLDLSVYSQEIQATADRKENPQIKFEDLIWESGNKIESMLIDKIYWASTHFYEVRVFDRNGNVYTSFETNSSFIEHFKEVNEIFFTIYKRIKQDISLRNIIFSDKEDLNQNELVVLSKFILKLNRYLENNGDKSRLMNFPSLDLRLNSNQIIKLFEEIIKKKDDLIVVYGEEEYLNFIVLFFQILITIHSYGNKFFNLIGVSFNEDSYISKLASIVEQKIGIDIVLKTILSLTKIKTKVLNDVLIKNIYNFRYGFIFDELTTPIEEIFEMIGNLLKELPK